MVDATAVKKAREIRDKNRAGIPDSGSISPPTQEMRIIPFEVPELSLDEGYRRYKEGRGFGRGDLYALIIDEIKELQRRIGSIDEAAVRGIEQRVASLETVIGKALTSRVETHDMANLAAVKPRGWPKGKKRGPRNVNTGVSADG